VATQPRRVSLPPPPPHNLILIDPAHGGSETGALLSQHLAEKDVTLALAARLRSTLQSHGFNVLTTRDSDAALTTLQRAEMANHAAPIACLILHATAAGNGVHVFTSALAPVARRGAVLPWSTAQAAFAQQSADLALQIHTALAHSHFPVIQLQTSLAPLDNLTCPAVAVEIAPALGEDASTTLDPGNAGYQQQVVESLATALVNWRGQAGVTP
jgi:N-acetylmuramoyl-L-alanine amidase